MRAGATGPKKQASGLRLDSREAVLEGGENGPAIVPGDPDKSLLIQAVRQTHEDYKMPPKGKLPDPAVEALAEWVKRGAPWPVATAATVAARPTQSAATHWAFRPVAQVAPPAVEGAGVGRVAGRRLHPREARSEGDGPVGPRPTGGR